MIISVTYSDIELSLEAVVPCYGSMLGLPASRCTKGYFISRLFYCSPVIVANLSPELSASSTKRLTRALGCANCFLLKLGE